VRDNNDAGAAVFAEGRVVKGEVVVRFVELRAFVKDRRWVGRCSRSTRRQ
jgi:hypothetical protein